MQKIDFGHKIKNARRELGLTQNDLAKIIGVTPESISYYESGKKCPTHDKLKNICRVLKLNMGDL